MSHLSQAARLEYYIRAPGESGTPVWRGNEEPPARRIGGGVLHVWVGFDQPLRRCRSSAAPIGRLVQGACGLNLPMKWNLSVIRLRMSPR